MRLSIATFTVVSLFLISACGGGSGGSSVLGPNPVPTSAPTPNPSPAPSVEPTAVPTPNPTAAPLEVYEFENESGVSTVSYTGQTARQVLISDLVSHMEALQRDVGSEPEDTVTNLAYYYSLEADIRDGAYTPVFSLGENVNLIGNDSAAATNAIAPGEISSNKGIKEKLAGQDSPSHILGGEFFGWQGVNSPEGLVDELFRVLGDEAADETDTISVSGGTANISLATVTEAGLDLRQLIQKFLLGALTFSQGTADYLSIDYASDANLSLAPGSPYTEGAHDFDEAFGYFGAARNYGDLEDSVIAEGYALPESDTVVTDGAIDLRSEYNFGNAQNCAKRDQGTAANTNPTDYTKEAFDAFVQGRALLQQAATGATESSPGALSDADAATLARYITIAAQTWEKCIAATVVHYINDVLGDMDNFVGDEFASLAHFTDLAKHWSEMKGFALGLQFSPYSPFRTGKVMVAGTEQDVVVDIDDLKQVLTLFGDAPVLADGTQDVTRDNTENGELYAAAADATAAKAAYRQALIQARDILQTAYAFDGENVENW